MIERAFIGLSLLAIVGWIFRWEIRSGVPVALLVAGVYLLSLFAIS